MIVSFQQLDWILSHIMKEGKDGLLKFDPEICFIYSRLVDQFKEHLCKTL